ncbi:MAG TPA: helix-turn-helix domain-containing protein [Arachidicoccus sp.]
MKKQFERLESIGDTATFEKVRAYFDEMISTATRNGYLNDPENDNEFTKEIGRIGAMLANYESIHMQFKHIKVKNPLIISIENQMRKKALNQRQTAELLEVKENTLSQIMTGKRDISMKMAKKLYKSLKIDPKTIIEYA